ncbi:MAG: glycosyltransferase family 2 protein [Rothia sp. (in: high G+C Gram-positive bacteria)]|uniref:glycosyltransferase family 2 protein n=1 Tax=Rothia sp. (in: high G+C Gram-positive bacteria) TaxID=1885016 RepID=UPI0026DF8C44|nr:glycosyltransferase family 2 protein [Rothia sp. (in: high G+C Gram-positive bacteria)]MDO5749758.1 glycosyltransferase family 2 protein [Rothia sp. (in: high G+C Gram-positive bacteria)]
MTSTVAIVVRTKDRPKFLARALKDISEQTFQDFQVCIVNDGGDRERAEQVLALSPLASRAQIIHTEGLGMEAASNVGIRATDSTYICIHDDDDLWDPRFLEVSVQALDASDAYLSSVRVVQRFERETPDGFELERTEILHGDIHQFGLHYLTRTNRAVPIGVMYRRSLHELIGYYDESLPVVGDWEFNIRAAQVAEILVINEPLAYWCIRPQASGATANSISRPDEHRFYDSRVRDEALRAYIAQLAPPTGSPAGKDGTRPHLAALAPLLTQAHYANELDGGIAHSHQLSRDILERLDRLNERLDALEHQLNSGASRLEVLEERTGHDSVRLARLEHNLSWRGKLQRLFRRL